MGHTPEDTKAMKDLMSKLSGKGLKAAKTSGSSNPDVKAMSTILSRLNESTKKVAKQARKDKTPSDIIAMTNKTESGVGILDYEIIIEKSTKSYKVQNRHKETLYDNISLFESAVGIVNALLKNKDIEANDIYKLDGTYGSKLNEAKHYKTLLKRDNDSFDVELYETQFEENKRKVIHTRREIRKQMFR
jgi:hypothetical protein